MCPGEDQISSRAQEQEMMRQEIESTDKMIDRFVYELYTLSEKEIRIVELVNSS